MTMKKQAQAVAAQGRRGDTEIVHMSKSEIAALHGIASLAGRKLTKNPKTGAHEAFNLFDILPLALNFIPGIGTLASIGLTAAAGAASAAVDHRNVLQGALMGGITGGIGSALSPAASGLETAAGAGIGQAGANAATQAAGQAAMQAGTQGALQQAAAQGIEQAALPAGINAGAGLAESGAQSAFSSLAPEAMGSLSGVANSAIQAPTAVQQAAAADAPNGLERWWADPLSKGNFPYTLAGGAALASLMPMIGGGDGKKTDVQKANVRDIPTRGSYVNPPASVNFNVGSRDFQPGYDSEWNYFNNNFAQYSGGGEVQKFGGGALIAAQQNQARQNADAKFRAGTGGDPQWLQTFQQNMGQSLGTQPSMQPSTQPAMQPGLISGNAFARARFAADPTMGGRFNSVYQNGSWVPTTAQNTSDQTGNFSLADFAQTHPNTFFAKAYLASPQGMAAVPGGQAGADPYAQFRNMRTQDGKRFAIPTTPMQMPTAAVTQQFPTNPGPGLLGTPPAFQPALFNSPTSFGPAPGMQPQGFKKGGKVGKVDIVEELLRQQAKYGPIQNDFEQAPKLRGTIQDDQAVPTMSAEDFMRAAQAGFLSQRDPGYARGGIASVGHGSPMQAAHVQALMARGQPGRHIDGSGRGMADDVPAHIDGKQKAALSSGEFVIPADVVSMLGDGNTKAGAKELQMMIARIRQTKTGSAEQAAPMDPAQVMPS